MTPKERGTVFVSGATGFIALHIINNLLQQGYKVIGSARSQEKVDHLLELFNNNPSLSLEIVPNIDNPEAFDDVFKKYGNEIKVVLHAASPIPRPSTDYEKEYLIPAVEGVKSILNAVKKYAANSVERVILTSSAAAAQNSTDVVSEESWNDATWKGCQTDSWNAYAGSKTFAERAAWEFMEENKNVIKFTLTTVNPVYTLGPQAFSDKKFASTSAYIEQIISSTEDNITPKIAFWFVDVRDVAKAHILAFQNDNLVGKRLLLAADTFSYQDVLNIANEDFKELNGKIPIGEPEKADALTKENKGLLDNHKTKELLGFEFIGLRQCVDDSIKQILEVKH
ncbi:SDR family oxidoreductase NDAI_0F01560 [Naumovozyma dairenensis CBS 421]|uniref:NAD-dependent epimerase/dehydratase domain-containing protein n=1 Tax=Naumovozyma dairenensis (strain ATCC 10597 / BCRC 20456 / CBS 421 / NBRC 0211 / NRRL Y-12639) TaxID=1071378 RepID=G0WCG4_NAUDC|nr:hypothetical protein NDAI_0F01560 [Naumovozyma dairenensis CBS 421]CCD25475.1 hypothetical protein NDAI_0F01560 [Naumovozyma dairenensis CBS 421]